MSTKINLHFIDAVLSELSDDEEYILTRLMGWIVFKTPRGWSTPMDAIIDTGAHTSILPKSIWKSIKIKKIGSYDILSEFKVCFDRKKNIAFLDGM